MPKKLSRQKLYAEVSRHTDTVGTQINAAETSRVIAMYFDTLIAKSYTPAELMAVLTAEIQAAEKRLQANVLKNAKRAKK